MRAMRFFCAVMLLTFGVTNGASALIRTGSVMVWEGTLPPQLLLFWDIADFEATVGVDSIATLTFDGFVESDSYMSVESISHGPAVVSPGSSGFVIGANAGYGEYGHPYFSAQSPDDEINELSIVFPESTQWFGLTYGSYIDTESGFEVVARSGAWVGTYVLMLPEETNTPAFVGFYWENGIDSIKITQDFGSTVFDILDLRVTAVPLPPAAGLLAVAVAGLGMMRRKAVSQSAIFGLGLRCRRS